MEILTPTGRANDELQDKLLMADEIKEYKLKLLEIDQKYYGYDWLPYTPITASGCLQHLYSLYINIEGNVRPCAPTKLDEHPALRVDGEYPYNINKMSLRKIYGSDLFTYVRNIDKVLEGKCGNCEYIEECIGCRGYAYSVGITMELIRLRPSKWSVSSVSSKRRKWRLKLSFLIQQKKVSAVFQVNEKWR